MKIIDLSWRLEDWIEYYPWDPKTEITNIETIEISWWNMKRLKINSHDSTHVNVPIHSEISWKTLDDYDISDFIGESILYKKIDDIKHWIWIIFDDININKKIAERIIKIKPKFVWLSDRFEFNIEIEKDLLKNDIISFERLSNTSKLPNKFTFHWVPLKIYEWDGSPVRAYAIID